MLDLLIMRSKLLQLTPEMNNARWSVYVCCSYWTWAQSGASYFLDALSLAEGAAVERGRVGAGPRALLEASPAAAVTHRPLCPGGPASIHCKVREKEHGHTSSPAWAAPRRFWLSVTQPQTVATRDGMRNTEQAQIHVSNTPSVCQKSLYKLKKCWCWMKNTTWWLSGLAGDLPYPENQPEPALSAWVECVWPKSLQVQRARALKACALKAALFSRGR